MIFRAGPPLHMAGGMWICHGLPENWIYHWSIYTPIQLVYHHVSIKLAMFVGHWTPILNHTGTGKKIGWRLEKSDVLMFSLSRLGRPMQDDALQFNWLVYSIL